MSGALLPLTHASEWQQVTGITPDEAAARWKQMMDEFFVSGGVGECADMGCCPPEVILKKIDPDTGRPVISTDGGETWIPDPDDPQYGIMVIPPVVGVGGSTKCDAASNALQHFTDVVNWSSSNIATASTVYALGLAVATVLIEIMLVVVTGGAALVWVPTVAAMLMGVGTSVFSLGQEAFDAYWDSDAFDTVLCALYCNIGENGQFTEDQYQAWRTQVNSELPSSPARDFVMTTINAGGAAGLSNMASYGGAADSDCSECDCDDPSDVWFTMANGTNIPLYADEDGYYTASTGSETPYAGWFGTVWFREPPTGNESPYANCWRVTDVEWPTIEAGLAGAINCADGGYENPPLSSFCYAAIQWYTAAGAWSVKFKVDDTCP